MGPKCFSHVGAVVVLQVGQEERVLGEGHLAEVALEQVPVLK